MRHSPARSDGRGHLSSGAAAAWQSSSWLLVGNSRWHWAETTPEGLAIRHDEAAQARRQHPAVPPQAWAAVGRLPAGWAEDDAGRVRTADVPLRALPDWLGVDRALAGWQAWRQCGEAVLVADAGTVLSLTRVDRSGCFAGGRLMAGLALQLRAMAAGTAALPDAPFLEAFAALQAEGGWPAATAAAMAVGVQQGLAAALSVALRQTRQELPGCRLLLCGGDAAGLLPLVRQQLAAEADAVALEPDLALRGLVSLRPAPSRMRQSSPRSDST